MLATTILSIPVTVMSATAVLPSSEAGAALPGAAASFGALVDDEGASPAQPAVATLFLDPSGFPTPPGSTAKVADMLTAQVAEVEKALAPPPVAQGEAANAVQDKADLAFAPPQPLKVFKPEPAADSRAPAPQAPEAQPSVPAPQHTVAIHAASAEKAVSSEEKSADDPDAETGKADGSALALATVPQGPPLPSANLPVPIAQPIATTQPEHKSSESKATPLITKAAGAKQATAAQYDAFASRKESIAGDNVPSPEQHGPAIQTAVAVAAIDQGDKGLPSPLLTQTMVPVSVRPSAIPYPTAFQTAVHAPVVQAQPGRIGADIGVEIAKAANGDREDLLIRLDPRDLGRIDVRLSFDREGMLRAVVSADSSTALDMLRRESGDLNRALADAGIRLDGQSLRFDARSGGDQGQGAGQGWQRGQQHQAGAGSHGLTDDGLAELTDAHYRPLRASGQIDLMA